MGKGASRGAGMKQITITVPNELFELVGGSEKEAATFLIQTFVVELVRRKLISSGKASEVLRMSRWDMHDLLGRSEVCTTDFDPMEDLKPF